MNVGDLLVCMGIAFLCFVIGVAANSVILRPSDLTTIATKCDNNGGLVAAYLTDKVVECKDGAKFDIKIGQK